MTQQELGAPYYARMSVSAMELGKTTPSIKTLVHFAKRLRISVHDLIPEDL